MAVVKRAFEAPAEGEHQDEMMEEGSSSSSSGSGRPEEAARTPQDEEKPTTAAAQIPKMLKTPYSPTAKEVEEHEATHLPYQPWCPHCIQGKAPNRAHRKSARDQVEKDGVPVVVMDYMFMSSKEQDKMSPILVMKDMKSKHVFAHVVSRKGTSNAWIVKRLTEDLDSLGYGWTKVIIRSDQEYSIVDVKNQLRLARWTEFEKIIRQVTEQRRAKTEVVREDLGPVTILEESPVAESSSNGAAENAIRHVQGQFRTLKSQLEGKLGGKLPITHPVWTWLMEWAALTISRYHISKDGLTAYQRHSGKTCLAAIANFGEKVMYRVLDNKHVLDKHEGRYKTGIWLGLISRTDESLIGTEAGVVKAAAVKRLGEDSKWSLSDVQKVCGCPWKPVPAVEGDHVPIFIRSDGTGIPLEDEDTRIEVDMPETQAECTSEAQMEMQKQELIRDLKVTQRLVHKYGPTPGCLGCRRIVEHAEGRTNHTPACRRRIKKLMAEDPGGQQDLRMDVHRQERAELRGAKRVRFEESGDDEGMQEEAAARTAGASSSRGPASDDRDVEMTEPGAAVEHHSKREAAAHEEEREPKRRPLGCLERQLEKTMKEISVVDVTETYSPTRVNGVAASEGLQPGWSLDLTTHNARGEPWDFTKVEKRNEAYRLIAAQKPWVLVGSPPCTMLSALQNLNPKTVRSGTGKWKKPGSTSGSAACCIGCRWRAAGTSCTSTPRQPRRGRCKKWKDYWAKPQ